MKKRFWIGVAIFAAVMAGVTVIGVVALSLCRTPFIGLNNYLRLFLQDSVFLQAFWNTFWLPAVQCAAVTAGFLVLKRLVLNKWRFRGRDPVCYTVLAAALFLPQAAWLPQVLGLPSAMFSPGMVVGGPAQIFSPTLLDYLQSPFYLLFGWILLELSLFFGLLAWVIDGLCNRQK